MKKNLILIFAILFLLYSCGKRCSGKSKFSGVIQTDLNKDCLSSVDFDDGIIIDNDSVFNYYFDGYYADCFNVDFNNQTLLGLYADGGCKASFIKNVEIDNSAQKYIYTVKVKNCGLCQALSISNNLVLVPKLPDNWTVEFKVK